MAPFDRMEMAKPAAIQSFKCPRCQNRDFTLFRRGTLTNDSAFLPRKDRGRQEAIKVPVRCLNCGYIWRSISSAVELLLEEEPNGTP
jgi:DNA-directed RNA polymerase subunit M/transcription elongation factor TFIIS